MNYSPHHYPKREASSCSSIPHPESYKNDEQYATNLYLASKTATKTSHLPIMFMVLALIVSFLLGLLCLQHFYPLFGESQGSTLSATHSQSKQDIQTMLDSNVEMGMMNVSIAPHFAIDENLSGDLGVVNISENHVDQKITLKTKDGETLYESEFISPGQSLGVITLTQKPSPDDTMLYAVFTGFDRTTHEEIGSMSVEISLTQKGTEQ